MGVMILRVILEVGVEVIDASGQQRNLHLGGTGVALVTGIFLDLLVISDFMTKRKNMRN